jgi:hypothetical protein
VRGRGRVRTGQVERFSAEEDELLRIMWDDDGQHDVMDGVGEQQLLFPEVFPRNVQTAPAPPADRLNPSVPHSPEFDYSFQEMMQAEFEAQMGEMQSHRHNLGTHACHSVSSSDRVARLCILCR